MALIKEKTMYGITADYWKITNCDVKSGTVMLGLYKDKESAKDLNNIIGGRLRLTIEFPAEVEGPLCYAYSQIKKGETWFADAEDDF